jgi:hypothetical protein
MAKMKGLCTPKFSAKGKWMAPKEEDQPADRYWAFLLPNFDVYEGLRKAINQAVENAEHPPGEVKSFTNQSPEWREEMRSLYSR